MPIYAGQGGVWKPSITVSGSEGGAWKDQSEKVFAPYLGKWEVASDIGTPPPQVNPWQVPTLYAGTPYENGLDLVGGGLGGSILPTPATGGAYPLNGVKTDANAVYGDILPYKGKAEATGVERYASVDSVAVAHINPTDSNEYWMTKPEIRAQDTLNGANDWSISFKVRVASIPADGVPIASVGGSSTYQHAGEVGEQGRNCINMYATGDGTLHVSVRTATGVTAARVRMQEAGWLVADQWAVVVLNHNGTTNQLTLHTQVNPTGQTIAVTALNYIVRDEYVRVGAAFDPILAGQSEGWSAGNLPPEYTFNSATSVTHLAGNTGLSALFFDGIGRTGDDTKSSRIEFNGDMEDCWVGMVHGDCPVGGNPFDYDHILLDTNGTGYSIDGTFTAVGSGVGVGPVYGSDVGVSNDLTANPDPNLQLTSVNMYIGEFYSMGGSSVPHRPHRWVLCKHAGNHPSPSNIGCVVDGLGFIAPSDYFPSFQWDLITTTSDETVRGELLYAEDMYIRDIYVSPDLLTNASAIASDVGSFSGTVTLDDGVNPLFDVTAFVYGATTPDRLEMEVPDVPTGDYELVVTVGGETTDPQKLSVVQPEINTTTLLSDFSDPMLTQTQFRAANTQFDGLSGGVVTENLMIDPAICELQLTAHGDDYNGPIVGADINGQPVARKTKVGSAIASQGYCKGGSYRTLVKMDDLQGAAVGLWCTSLHHIRPNDPEFADMAAAGLPLLGGASPYYERKSQVQISVYNTDNVRMSTTALGSTTEHFALAHVSDGAYHELRFDWDVTTVANAGNSWQAVGTVTFYVDGALVGTITTDIPDQMGRMWVGHWFPQEPLPATSWVGEFAPWETRTVDVLAASYTPAATVIKERAESYPLRSYRSIDDTNIIL